MQDGDELVGPRIAFIFSEFLLAALLREFVDSSAQSLLSTEGDQFASLINLKRRRTASVPLPKASASMPIAIVSRQQLPPGRRVQLQHAPPAADGGVSIAADDFVGVTHHEEMFGQVDAAGRLLL
jgi:hypothetical protein